MTNIPETQHAIQFVGVDQIVVNPAKPVYPVGPHQMLLKVEACGICFSDTKLLHAFDTHPRKTGLVSGLSPEVLAEIPSYASDDRPTTPGHEPVGRIVVVGDQVTHFKVGDRVLVQADWKHLPTATSNGAFGYNFEGALQEYALIDERCVVAPSGEEYLLHVADGPSSAAIGLIEPWATVEGSYAWPERHALLPGGRLLVVTDPGVTPSHLDALIAAATPASIATHGCSLPGATALDDLAAIAPKQFDDIVYFGADADTAELLGPLLATRGYCNVVLGGVQFGRRVKIDVGRIHYDYIRYCGTTGSDPADGYAWIPATGEIRPGDSLAVLGAAGPMGLMHVMRAAVSGVPGITIDATDLSDDRLAHLAKVVDPAAAADGVRVRYVNTGGVPLQPGYTFVVCLVPVPAVLAQSVDLAGPGAIVNAFAGVAAGTLVELDLQHVIADHVFILGTSGSENTDMATVLRKIESGRLDTTISLDAITGMAGFTDAINSVINRTSGGKIMVFPMLHDMGLVRLAELPDVMPEVAAAMDNGRWTPAAEAALLRLKG